MEYTAAQNEHNSMLKELALQGYFPRLGPLFSLHFEILAYFSCEYFAVLVVMNRALCFLYLEFSLNNDLQ